MTRRSPRPGQPGRSMAVARPRAPSAAGSNVNCDIGSAAAAEPSRSWSASIGRERPERGMREPERERHARRPPSSTAPRSTGASRRRDHYHQQHHREDRTTSSAVHLDCSRAPPCRTARSRRGPTVTRLFGANRYDTAAKLSQQHDSDPGAGVPVVYVATGLQFPDALAGAPAAHGESASILLVQQGIIPNETKAELTRLNPTQDLRPRRSGRHL